MISLLMQQLSPFRLLLIGALLGFEFQQPLVLHVPTYFIDLLLAFKAVSERVVRPVEPLEKVSFLVEVEGD